MPVITLLLVLALATPIRAQTPCGYSPTGPGEPPSAWYTEDGDGNPRPCPSDAPPIPPAPLPELPARAWLPIALR